VLPDDTQVCPSCGNRTDHYSDSANLETAAPAARRSVVYAGFWLRGVAYLIDVVLLTMIGGAAILMPLLARGAIPADKPWFLFTEQTRQVLAIQLLFNMLSWLYFASFESSAWQATPGKRMLGLVVTDLAGRRITFLRASGRFFGKFISQLLLFFGFVMAGITPRKQALHDILASCLVVRRPRQS
jgi:uncharacterized RDD family membrane protein YckC